MKKTTMSLVVAVCMVPLALQAGMFGWFGNNEKAESPETAATNTVKRLHLTLTDKDAEKELIQLTAARRVVMQERQVLLMLIDEKKRDLSNFESAFSKTFGIRRDRNYRYDAKTKSIYELEEKSGSDTNAPGPASEPKLVKKLESESDTRQFASLAAAKQLAQEDLLVLARLVREKEGTSEHLDEALKDKFSMSRDRNYWYDPTSRKLFELVNPSRKGMIE